MPAHRRVNHPATFVAQSLRTLEREGLIRAATWPGQDPRPTPRAMILFHIHDHGPDTMPAARSIANGWTAVAAHIDELRGAAGVDMRHCLFDVDLTVFSSVVEVRALLAAAPSGIRIFACRPGEHHGLTQAGALGATTLVDRPFGDDEIRDLLPGPDQEAGPDMPSSIVALMAIDRCFRSLNTGTPLRVTRIEDTASLLAEDIDQVGIAAWLQSIREHHAGTYRHCLQVSGLATAFAQSLGFPDKAVSDLSVAALLHDIGKAKVGHDILDKPGRLAPAELTTMRMHPVWGEEYLRASSDVSGPIRSAVRSHHEFLDGSGYPDGLKGRQISDLTRLVTIADIFAALIEIRSYKPAMSAEDGMGVLRAMANEGKLEKALVEAFWPVARHLTAASSAQA